MVYRIRRNELNLRTSLDNCFQYVIDSEYDDPETTRSYMDGLNSVITALHDSGVERAWEIFADTGIFHDSEGKVLDVTEDYVELTTEY